MLILFPPVSLLVVAFCRRRYCLMPCLLASTSLARRYQSGMALREMREALREANYELDRVDALVSGAERVTERVDAASALGEVLA